MPFRVGEQLDYRVGWANFLTAATAHLVVTERRNFYRWDAWHFQAVAHTVDPLRYLFALDDQFDSYTDAATLSSRQYELYLQEQDKQSTQIVRMSVEHEPLWSEGPFTIVAPGTRDPLAALYYLRTVDWQRTPEATSPVYDGKKLYQMRAHLDAVRDHVTVPAGTYSASRIQVRIYDNGQELAQTHFRLWLAHDPARTPVLVEGEVPVGTLRIELTKASE